MCRSLAATSLTADSLPAKDARGNGATVRRTYDAKSGFLDNILTDVGTLDVQSLAMRYDASGNLVGRTDTAVRNRRESFGYDALERLTRVAVGNTVATQSYDIHGNIVSKTGVGTYHYEDPSRGNRAYTRHIDGYVIVRGKKAANGSVFGAELATGSPAHIGSHALRQSCA